MHIFFGKSLRGVRKKITVAYIAHGHRKKSQCSRFQTQYLTFQTSVLVVIDNQVNMHEGTFS